MPSLLFLGSGDSQGVPRFWCACVVCEEARTVGMNARTRPSVVIEGSERILIDAAPELRMQATRAGLKGFDAALITHAHNDHILGLGDLGDRARWTKELLPVYAPAEVLPLLRPRFPYMANPGSAYLELLPLLPLEETTRTFAGYRLTHYKVPHGFNGWSYAFRFDSKGGSWGYMSDCIGLEDIDHWIGLDLLVLGTSFYKEDAPRAGRSVYDVGEAMALLQVLKPQRTVFTHLGHGIDRRKEAPAGTAYAFDGMTLELP